jgi:serine/threonine-protein kinase
MEKTNLDLNPLTSGSAPTPRPTLLDANLGTEFRLDLRTLGRYRLLRPLGEGGMGTVYLGCEDHSPNRVALKVLHENLASQQAYVDRFYREASSGSKMNHPNIVRTYEYGKDTLTGRHYLVMEFVDGPTAQEVLSQRGPWSIRDVVELGFQIARALEHAHSRNFIHRDIKPDNILISRSGIAKLADMGLAKRVDIESFNHITIAHTGFGTTAYMPYEQAVNARNVDGRSDIYALGATLYYLLTGQVPFPGESDVEIVEKKKLGRFQAASNLVAGVPPMLDALLARMMACMARDRFQTASEVIIELERSFKPTGIFSFADTQLALMERPQLRLVDASIQPTRPDPEAPVRDTLTQWEVTYTRRNGRVRTLQMTTEEIIQSLKEDNLPVHCVVRRSHETKGRPLEAVPEFAPFVTFPLEAEGGESAESQNAVGTGRGPLGNYVLWSLVGIVFVGLMVLLVRGLT